MIQRPKHLGADVVEAHAMAVNWSRHFQQWKALKNDNNTAIILADKGKATVIFLDKQD